MFLNIVDQGTNFQVVVHLLQGTGVPSSKVCADAFMLHWVSWAGWPKEVVVDRGLHNRGRFARMLGAHGICPRNTGLESPEQLGRTERHGDMWKMTAKRAIVSKKIIGADHMKLLSCENNPVMNENSRKGGFAPAQWVLGKFPRRPGEMMDEDEFADLGVLSERLDPQSAFQLQTQYRLACKKAFAEVDCSDGVARAVLRKAAPVQKEYAVGDSISFKRKQGADTVEQLWSTPTRIIGFDGDRIVWGLCESLPVCLAIDKIRPCTSSETLAYLYLNKNQVPKLNYNPPQDGIQENYLDFSRDAKSSNQMHIDREDDDEPMIPVVPIYSGQRA